MSSSFVTPFSVVGGRIASTTDPVRQVEQKIIDVLVTGKMERPTIPDYGAGAQQLLFDIIEEAVEADFKTDAGMELSSRISNVNIMDIRVAQSSDDPTTAVITVIYRTALSTVRSVTFEVSAGIITEETDF